MTEQGLYILLPSLQELYFLLSSLVLGLIKKGQGTVEYVFVVVLCPSNIYGHIRECTDL